MYLTLAQYEEKTIPILPHSQFFRPIVQIYTYLSSGEKLPLLNTYIWRREKTRRKRRRDSQLMWVALDSVFFSRENQKCPWKPFLPIFSIFFTRGKSFSRALFSVFSRFLHGYTNRFHGRSLSKKLSFSRGKLLKIFHGHRFFFTGGIWRKSSRARFSFHGHFLGKNLVFFTGGFFFFHGKKKPCPPSTRTGGRGLKVIEGLWWGWMTVFQMTIIP